MPNIRKLSPKSGDRISLFGYEKVLGLIISPSEDLDSLELVLPPRPAHMQQVTVMSKRDIGSLRIFGGCCPESPKSVMAHGNFTLIYDAEDSTWILWQSRRVESATWAALAILGIFAARKAIEEGWGEILYTYLTK